MALKTTACSPTETLSSTKPPALTRRRIPIIYWQSGNTLEAFSAAYCEPCLHQQTRSIDRTIPTRLLRSVVAARLVSQPPFQRACSSTQFMPYVLASLRRNTDSSGTQSQGQRNQDVHSLACGVVMIPDAFDRDLRSLRYVENVYPSNDRSPLPCDDTGQMPLAPPHACLVRTRSRLGT